MDITLQAKKRDISKKASWLRKNGWVPACVYGRHMESTAIQIPLAQVKMALGKNAKKMNIQVEGLGKMMVGLEEAQRGALGNDFVHLSFHALSNNEIATLVIPIEFVGKAIGTTTGGIIQKLTSEITVKGYPANLPDKITVDVAKLDLGHSIHLVDIIGKNQKFEFLTEDHDKVLATCNYPKLKDIAEPAAAVTTDTTIEPVGAEANAPVTPATTFDTNKKAA